MGEILLGAAALGCIRGLSGMDRTEIPDKKEQFMKAARYLLFSLLGLGAFSVPLRSQGNEPVSVTVFGTDVFTRGRGAPISETRTFAVPAMAKAPYHIRVTNGNPDGSGRVSSAQVSLNGSAIFNPFNFNQQIDVLRREVNLQQSNALRVELRSAPGSTLAITIQGHVDPDETIARAIHEVDGSGGTFELPDIASLEIPPGAVGPATVEIVAVDSALMKFLATKLHASISVLDSPALRIKSSARLSGPVELRVHVAGLSDLLGDTQRLTFLTLNMWTSDSGEASPRLQPIGGTHCGKDAACVILSPDWFLAANPADPNDPVIQLAAAITTPQLGRFRLWQLDNISPAADSRTTIPVADVVPLRVTFTIAPNFTFESPFLQDFEPLLAGCPLFYPPQLCVTDGFYRSGYGRLWQPGDLHAQLFGALDLRTQSSTNNSTDQAVAPVMAGWVGEAGYRTLGGNYIAVQHDGDTFGPDADFFGGPGLITRYLHLSWYAPLLFQVFPHQQMAVSGDTGDVDPHLHVDAMLDLMALDTEPLLSGNLSHFLAPKPSPGPNGTIVSVPTFPRLAMTVMSSASQGNFGFSFVPTPLTSLQTHYEADLAPSDIASLCPTPATACDVTATLQLFGGRFGGTREVMRWALVIQREPVIQTLSASPASVSVGDQATVSVEASDPDGDLLTYAWAPTCGSLSGTTGPGDKSFTAPSTPGACTVSVTVTDTSGLSATRSVDIAVVEPLIYSYLHHSDQVVREGEPFDGQTCNGCFFSVGMYFRPASPYQDVNAMTFMISRQGSPTDGVAVRVYEAMDNPITGQLGRGTLLARSNAVDSSSINQEPDWYNSCHSFEIANAEITEDCFTATFLFSSAVTFSPTERYLVLLERTGSPLPLFNYFILSGRSSFDFPRDPENAQVRCEQDGDCEIRNNGAPVYTVWKTQP